MKKVLLILLTFAASGAQAETMNLMGKLTALRCITQNEDTATVYQTVPGKSKSGEVVLYLNHTYQSGLFSRKTVSYLITDATFDTSTHTYNILLRSSTGTGEMDFKGNGGSGTFKATDDTGSGQLDSCAVWGNW